MIPTNIHVAKALFELIPRCEQVVGGPLIAGVQDVAAMTLGWARWEWRSPEGRLEVIARHHDISAELFSDFLGRAWSFAPNVWTHDYGWYQVVLDALFRRIEQHQQIVVAMRRSRQIEFEALTKPRDR